MKPPRKRLAILHQPEIQDLFGPPRLTIEEKRFYFTLNDLELKSFQSIRDSQQRCHFVVLLGYFKVKPVMLNIGLSDVRDDLDFVRAEYLPETNSKGQNLTKSQRSRIYQRIFENVGYRGLKSTGRGYGTSLYETLLAELRNRSYHVAIAGIELPNSASIALHEKFGMAKVAHFKEVGFKFGKWIDVGYCQVQVDT